MRYTYLLIDLFSMLFPLLFSFHPRLQFYKSWPAFLPAALISGLVFVVWDMYFTHLKVWGFNQAYLTGVYFGNLPMEEALFFFCIPYACVFTYAALPQKGFTKGAERIVTLVLIGVSVLLAVFFNRRPYTTLTFGLLASLIFISRFVLKVKWLSRFYQTYLWLLIPFFLVNGLLTGTCLASPVVWYNRNDMLNLRLLTIPVEDIFYGMVLILLNVLIYNGIRKRFYQCAKKRRQTEVSFGTN